MSVSRKNGSEQNNSPAYLNDLLKQGYQALHDHLTTMLSLPTRMTCKEVYEKMTFTEEARVILQARDASCDIR